MSKNMKQTFKVTALAAALFAVYGSALAQESSVSVGIGNWSGDRAQAGIYDGMRDSGAYGLLDADITKRDEATGTALGLKARNLGVDSREIQGTWERQGDIGASIEYSRITRDTPYTVNTGLQGIGTTTQTVTSITPGTGANVQLSTTRDRVTAKFFKNLGTGLNFNMSFRNEEKDGLRHWGRGSAADFVVEPISSTIRLLEATLSYARNRLQLSGGFYGTSYSNANSIVNVNSGATYLSLPLDNKSYEFFLNGGYNFTPTTRGTFKASYSSATQNEALGNFGNTAHVLAPKNLDGRLDTTLLELGLTAKPLPKLSVVANLRYRDFDDKTPLVPNFWSGATGTPPGSTATGTPAVWNTPFSYTNKTGKLEGTYRLEQGYSVLGGIEYKGQDRTVPRLGTLYVPFRATVNETSYRAQLNKSMSETVNGSLAYMHSKRDGSDYVLPVPAIQRDINPSNIADRKRDKLRAMVDWSPTDRVALQFAMEDSKDNYSGNTYGLQDGTARLYTADASFQVNSNWQIRGWVSRDETRANEITRANATTFIKYTNLTETGDSFGLGVKGQVSSKLKVGGDVESFRSVNQYQQSLVGGTLSASLVPLPDITNKMLKLKLFAQYALQKNADLHFNLMHERWDTNDWTWMYFPPTGAAPYPYGALGGDSTTVIANPKQNSTFIGVKYIYKFQ